MADDRQSVEPPPRTSPTSAAHSRGAVDLKLGELATKRIDPLRNVVVECASDTVAKGKQFVVWDSDGDAAEDRATCGGARHPGLVLEVVPCLATGLEELARLGCDSPRGQLESLGVCV